MTEAEEREINIKIGKNLRAIRQLRNITQEKLAESLGVTFQQVQKYERGKNRVTGGKMVRISEALNAPIMDFFAGIVDEMPTKAILEISPERMKILKILEELNSSEIEKSLRLLIDAFIKK
ncbi:MAG: hypothetical protein COA58_16760 [Bacteroidetes bacterium]|nr:MAG: hypothetical protein COA58_16760 [Bacteroidota bacterium]